MLLNVCRLLPAAPPRLPRRPGLLRRYALVALPAPMRRPPLRAAPPRPPRRPGLSCRYALAALLCWAPLACPNPTIAHWQTTAGSRVFLVEAHELPIVDLRLTFDAGAARDPAGKNGLALLVNDLLDEGAGELDATALNFEFERLGALYSASAGHDSASVSLRSLSDPARLQPALANLRRAVVAPAFSEAAVARQKQQRLLAIQRKQQAPDDIAWDAFARAVYPDHPYGFPLEGDRDSVAALERSDIAAFHRQFYTARNATLALVGDLTMEQARTLAEDLTGGLPPGRKPAPLPAAAPLLQPAEVKIDHPSSQVHVLLGMPGLRRGDPDYFPLYVGNHILGGGGFVSRLFGEVREKRGLSYSAYSYFVPRREHGPFVAGAQTRASGREEAVQVMRKTIAEFIAAGPTAAELTAAKKNISGGFPLRLDSNKKILDYLAMIAFYGLPLDYLDRFVEQVDAVTIEQIKDAFQRRLQPGRFVTVMAGPVGAAAAKDAALPAAAR